MGAIQQVLSSIGGVGGPDTYSFSNVSLLLHMNGANASTTFLDSSSNHITVTASGSAQLTTTGEKYGSACGVITNATSDRISAAASSGFDFGTGNFTIEFWIKTAGANGGTIFQQSAGVSINGLLVFNQPTLEMYFYGGASGSLIITSGVMTNIGNSQWHHVALVRSAGTFMFFYDGALSASATASGSIGNSINAFEWGRGALAASTPDANYDDIRITKGLALYTSAFTAPTAEFEGLPDAPTIGTAVAGVTAATVAFTDNDDGGSAITGHTATSTPGSLTGTGSSPITVSGLTGGTPYTFTVHATNAVGDSLESAASNSVTPVAAGGAVLLHFNGTDASTTITDSGTGSATWAASGNAQLDTAQKKFGSASLLLDGTGDYISSTDIGALPASGGWTIDCWVQFNAEPLYSCIFDYPNTGGFGVQVYRQGPAGVGGDGKLRLSLSSNGSSADIASEVLGTKSDFTTGTWYHIALVRDDSDGAYYLYVDGVLDKTVTSASQISNTIDRCDVGAQGQFSQLYLNGWIDEFHIADSCAYPGGTSFTPPTSEY